MQRQTSKSGMGEIISFRKTPAVFASVQCCIWILSLCFLHGIGIITPLRIVTAASSGVIQDEQSSNAQFLLLCLTDGNLVTIEAWTGRLEHRILTEPLLQKNAGTGKFGGDDNTAIVPGLDGRLYAYNEARVPNIPPQIQALPLTIASILDHPVRSCQGDDDEEDCGILTATAQTSLLALDHRGHLLWRTEQSRVRNDLPALLLQRRDYWVQHVSIATGEQTWNVSLGTYQALDFSSTDVGEELVIDDDGEDNSVPTNQAKLPLIVFSDSGHTLTAIHPDTRAVLWQQSMRSVLSTVFAISDGRWQPLTVVENHVDDSGATVALNGLEISSKGLHDPSAQSLWEGLLWLHTQEHYPRSFWQPQKLLPGGAPREEEVSKQCFAYAAGTPSTQCVPPNSDIPANLFMSTVESGSFQAGTHTSFQPDGLLLSWRQLRNVALFSVLLISLIVAGLVHLYMQKKRKWLQQSAKDSLGQSVGLVHSLSLEPKLSDADGRGEIRRCSSMPGALSATRRTRSRSDVGESFLYTREHIDDSVAEKSFTTVIRTEDKVDIVFDEPAVIQQAGIPLVRYSRYASEFEEIEAMGKGGFGTVFRCKNVLDGREYAVKKIYIQGSVGDKSFQKRLQRVLREVKILALLDHPNIVRYYTAWLEMDTKEPKPSESVIDPDIESERSSILVASDSVSQWEPDVAYTTRSSHLKRNTMRHPNGWKGILHDSTASLFSPMKPSDIRFVDHSCSEESSIDEREDESNTNNLCGIVKKGKSLVHIPTQMNGDREASHSQGCQHILYIQMQLCSRRTIDEFLSDERARRAACDDGISIPMALQLFLQISQAVQYVHKKGLIHRDLKPKNCFMDASGNVKVGDFGLSREVASESEDSSLNQSMSRRDSIGVSLDGHTAGVGTRAYASPEQTNGSDYDSTTDVRERKRVKRARIVLYCTEISYPHLIPPTGIFTWNNAF